MAGELTKRVAVAAVGIPFAIFILYIGGWPMTIVLALIGAMGANEYVRIARKTQIEPPANITILAAAVFVVIAGAWPNIEDAAPALWFLTTALLLICASAVIWTRGVEGKPLASGAAGVLGALLTGGTLAYAVLLREGFEADDRWLGFSYVAYPLAVTWINDTFAYFGGRKFGKHKLIPRVSPGKTIEGTVSGLIGSILTSVLFFRLVFNNTFDVQLGIGAAVIGGVLLSAAAVVGDLAESLLKREAGVKDSGTLLPGHGGVLDRFDALYFTIPAAFWFLYFATHFLSGAD